MNTPPLSSLSSIPERSAGPARPVLMALVAYVWAVAATLGAAAVVVAAGLPLDLLLTVA